MITLYDFGKKNNGHSDGISARCLLFPALAGVLLIAALLVGCGKKDKATVNNDIQGTSVQVQAEEMPSQAEETPGEAEKIPVYVNEKVVLEAGEELTPEKIVDGSLEKVSFVTDISLIETSRPGYYDIEVLVDGERFKVSLTVQDTVAPKAVAKEVETELGVVPEAVDCVTDIEDVTDVTISYEQEPDVSDEGRSTGIVKLVDSSGNSTLLDVPFNVIYYDRIAPVIEGTKNLEIIVGDSVSYKSGVSVTDNWDENPSLEIDNSAVDINKAGKYSVIYTATDASGNSSSVTVTVTVKEKPQTNIGTDVVYAMAQDILDDITDDSMDSMQVGYAIYYWCRHNIKYTGYSDKSSWTKGAYDAFKNRCGDCFTYYSAAKALFDVAGIENTMIYRSDTTRGQHFWNLINLGDGWYHVDTSPRNGPGDDFFMVTDAEILAYSETHNNTHIFDPTLFPERATKSVQDQINYRSSKLVR